MENGAKARQPALSRLVRRHNELVGVMERNIEDAPTGAQIPARLQIKGIYDLGIDDPIWRDEGNADSVGDGDAVDIPDWLGDEPTRKGIIAMLDLKCCQAEFRRLAFEKSALQVWYVTQHHALHRAIREAGECYSTNLTQFVLIQHNLYSLTSWHAYPPISPATASCTVFSVGPTVARGPFSHQH